MRPANPVDGRKPTGELRAAGRHTPGPWRFEPEFNEVVAEEEARHICAISDAYNARLIAAAPELLEALKTAAMHLKGLRDHDIDDVLSAAIAMAEGES